MSLLRLLQIQDSQFPIGAFAHSNGIEAYAHQGLDERGLRELLEVQVEQGWGRLELSALALAWRAPGLDALDGLGLEVEAWKPVAGLRSTSVRLGRRMVTLARRLWPDRMEELAALRRPHHPVVAGAVAARLAVPLGPALLAFAQGTAWAALTAASRCMPLSPERAQELLVALQPALLRAALRAEADPEASLYSATPGADLRGHEQAALHTRLFQS